MRHRGLPDPLLLVSDGAPGVIRAIEECFPRSARQRCLAHEMRNLQSKLPEDLWPEFKACATACYQAASPALARLLRDEIVSSYGAKLPSAVACLQDDFEACIAHLKFPLAHRRAIRTTNLLERLFGEERRRTKVIPHAFGERAVLKLMYAALIRAAERWRGLKMTEFEQRQLQAIRDELNRAHAEQTKPVVRADPTASQFSFIQQGSDLIRPCAPGSSNSLRASSKPQRASVSACHRSVPTRLSGACSLGASPLRHEPRGDVPHRNPSRNTSRRKSTPIVPRRSKRHGCSRLHAQKNRA
jgi:Transposase, Mutator family